MARQKVVTRTRPDNDSGAMNAMHAILTLCTGGLWLPVWLYWNWTRSRRSTSVTTIKGDR